MLLLLLPAEVPSSKIRASSFRLRYLRLGIGECTSTRKRQQRTGALTLGVRDGHVVEHRAWLGVEGTLEVESNGDVRLVSRL